MRDAKGPLLLVDDVLTTGGSMGQARLAWQLARFPCQPVIGAVVFARGPCPAWITPLFQMPEVLWLRKEQA